MKTRKSHAGTPAAERRAQQRVKLTAPLVARLVGSRVTSIVDEASTGGFSMRTVTPFDPGATYRFRLASSSGQVAVVAVMCRYCLQPEPPGEPRTHLVGFQFLPQDTQRLRLVLGAIAMDAP
jgi:hypothetical protein